MQKRLFGILASIAVIAAACGGATTSPSAAPPASVAPGQSAPPAATPAPSVSDLADDQVLRIDVGGEPTTLDPNKASSSDSLAILSALVRPLLAFDKDLKVVPGLAADLPVVSADAKTLTYTLRDAKYSNGDPIVAGDLVYSWKRMVDPRNPTDYGYVMCELAGVSKLLGACGANPQPSTDAEVEPLLAQVGVAAPDDKTFVVTLDKPATYFQSVTALWFTSPIQEKWITSDGAFEAGNYVSSGPFILDTFKHEDQIILKPNPNWYGLAPTLTEIDVSMIKEPAQVQAAFEAGELDMSRPPGADVARVLADPVLSPMVVQTPALSIYYYDFNNKTGPTANKEFRIALTQAVDKKALIQAAFAGLGQAANSFVMPGIPGYQADYDPYPFDPAKAKEHLATALKELGVPDAASLGKLSFGFNTGGDHETTVAFLAEAWRTILGVETEQIGSEFSVFQDERVDGKYTIDRNGWGADYPHASNQLGLFFCNGGNNAAQYCNPEFDKLMNQAAVEPDQDKQVLLYNQAQEILFNDAGILPLRFGLITYVVQPYVSGLQITPSDFQLPGDQAYETIKILKH